MKVTCIQTNPQEDVQENWVNAKNEIIRAKNNGSNLIVLPEMFAYMGLDRARTQCKSPLGEGFFKELQALAQKLSIHIVAGSHAEEIPACSDKVFNTCIALDNFGDIVSIYRKQHLFNLISAEGEKLYCESDCFEAGDRPQPYKISFQGQTWTALNLICYDIRFPEIIRTLSQPVDVIFVTAAFTWQTGLAHWEVLLRARAIENQCYVVACNQTGLHSQGKKRNFGHSMIIDPWGQIIASLQEEVDSVSAPLLLQKIEECRNLLPALRDRKIF